MFWSLGTIGANFTGGAQTQMADPDRERNSTRSRKPTERLAGSNLSMTFLGRKGRMTADPGLRGQEAPASPTSPETVGDMRARITKKKKMWKCSSCGQEKNCKGFSGCFRAKGVKERICIVCALQKRQERGGDATKGRLRQSAISAVVTMGNAGAKGKQRAMRLVREGEVAAEAGPAQGEVADEEMAGLQVSWEVECGAEARARGVLTRARFPVNRHKPSNFQKPANMSSKRSAPDASAGSEHSSSKKLKVMIRLPRGTILVREDVQVNAQPDGTGGRPAGNDASASPAAWNRGKHLDGPREPRPKRSASCPPKPTRCSGTVSGNVATRKESGQQRLTKDVATKKQKRLTKNEAMAAGIACSFCKDRSPERACEQKKLCSGCCERAYHPSCLKMRRKSGFGALVTPSSDTWYCERCVEVRNHRNSEAAAAADTAVQTLREICGPHSMPVLDGDGGSGSASGELGSNGTDGDGAGVRLKSEDGGDEFMRACHEDKTYEADFLSSAVVSSSSACLLPLQRKKTRASAGGGGAGGARKGASAGGGGAGGVSKGAGSRPGARTTMSAMSDSGKFLHKVITAQESPHGHGKLQDSLVELGKLISEPSKFGRMMADALQEYNYSGSRTTLLHLIMHIEDEERAEKILDMLLEGGLQRHLHQCERVPVDGKGQSPLYDAVLNLKFGCVELLTAKRPRTNGDQWMYNFMNAQDDEHKMTVLHHIVEQCSKEVCRDPGTGDMEDLIKMAKLIIEKGADVTKSDETGYTPLHFVVPSAEVVKPTTKISRDQVEKLASLASTMIDKGAQPDARCKDDWKASALYYVLALNNDGLSPLVGALCEKGADPLLDHTNDDIKDFFRKNDGIDLNRPENPWVLAHRNDLQDCIQHLRAAICRRSGMAAPEFDADTNSRLFQLRKQGGDPHEIVLPIPDGGGAGLKREDVDYLVKVLHHDVEDLATKDFSQQICVKESCAQYIPQYSDVAKAKAEIQAEPLKCHPFS